MSDAEQRLNRQIAFVEEIDRLKGVERRSKLMDGCRRENSAEHSWHVALAALTWAEHSDEPIDLARVISMLLLHDVVEIDAGDTFLYDEAGVEDKERRERAAAERLFGLLPEDQGRAYRSLWEEFEAGVTAEARFAAAVDRCLPVLHNARNRGELWRQHGIEEARVRRRNRMIRDGSKRLWRRIDGEIRRAFAGMAGRSEDVVAPRGPST